MATTFAKLVTPTNRTTSQFQFMEERANMLSIGIRRKKSREIVTALIHMRRDQVPGVAMRKAVLTAAAANIGLANPLLLLVLGGLDWKLGEHVEENGQVELTVECEAAALLASNMGLSLHVQLMTSVCSQLMSHRSLCGQLYNQTNDERKATALAVVNKAIQECTAESVRISCLYLAYLMFAEPDALVDALETNYVVLRHQVGPRWAIIMRFLCDELRDGPMAALFVMAFLLLVTRKELVIGPWHEPVADDRERGKINDYAMEAAEDKVGGPLFPDAVYDITTESGRIKNRTSDEYFRDSLYLAVQCTVWPTCLKEWLPPLHRRMVIHYYEMCMGIQRNAFNSCSRKIISKRGKLAAATSGEDQAKIKNLKEQIQDEERKKSQASVRPSNFTNCPLMITMDAINTTLTDMKRVTNTSKNKK
jgi:hypothetical protein